MQPGIALSTKDNYDTALESGLNRRFKLAEFSKILFLEQPPHWECTCDG